MKFEYTHALISGGSSGIGFQLAEDLADRGCNLLIVSLLKKEVDESVALLKQKFPNTVIRGMSVDLTLEDAPGKVLDYCRDQDVRIDLLVNNAGFGSYGFVNETSQEREVEMLKLHVLTVYKMTRLFMKEMIEKDHGCIVNISSVSAFQPNPKFSTYGASKSFVMYWTRAIAEDLKMQKSKVRAIAICPTPVRTKFQKNAKMMHSKLFDSWIVIDVKKVSDSIINAIEKNKKITVPGWYYELVNAITYRLPMSVKIWLAKLHLGEK